MRFHEVRNADVTVVSLSFCVFQQFFINRYGYALLHIQSDLLLFLFSLSPSYQHKVPEFKCRWKKYSARGPVSQ